jgi:hypothetical protein
MAGWDQEAGECYGCLISLNLKAASACPRRLGLADEMDGLEPGGQRQLGMFHHRAGRHRRLVPAADALKQLAGTLADEVVPHVVAARATEFHGPTRPLQSVGALLFSTEVPQELGDRHAGPELDLVTGHRGSPSSGGLRL